MKTRYRVPPIATALIAAALLALAGCTPDAVYAPDDPSAPATPDQALEALRAAYENMSIEAYADLLHPDFRFIFADPDKAPFLREDDLASTGRMFSGVEQKNSAGDRAPAVASIVFDRLEILEGWERVAEGEVDWSDEYWVLRALVSYRFTLNLKDGGRLSAGGRQVVYVASVVDGSRGPVHARRWQLLGQRDL